MAEYRDTEETLTLWDVNGRDVFIECPPGFEESLRESGVDPYDLEEIGRLFNCNVTRATTEKTTYQKDRSNA
jgi:hypothetical protein